MLQLHSEQLFLGHSINTLRPRQNGRHFTDDTFKRIFLNENFRISIIISLKFVPKGPINNIPALVQIMAWYLSGDKPLSEQMMARLPMHIYASLALNELMLYIYNISHLITTRHWNLYLLLCQKYQQMPRNLVGFRLPFYMTSHVCKVPRKHRKPRKLYRKRLRFVSHHFACWWPSTVRWQAICRYINDKIGIPCVYETGTW